MIAAAVAAVPPLVARTRSWWGACRLGRQPQWPVYVVAAAGWSLLVWLELARVQGNHGAHSTSAGSRSPLDGVIVHGLGLLGMLAVMAPLVAWNVRQVALRARAVDRGRVGLWVMGSWALGWLPVLAVVAALWWVAPGGVVLLMAATLFAIIWQCLPRKALALARCHRVVVPPLVRRAARGLCLRYGLRLGWDCGMSCGPMMVVMMAAGHSVFVVAPLTGVAWYERYRRPHHAPGQGVTAVVVAVVGLGAVVAGLAVT